MSTCNKEYFKRIQHDISVDSLTLNIDSLQKLGTVSYFISIF